MRSSSSLLDVALLLGLLLLLARGQPPPAELVPLSEHRPQRWDLRDVEVVPEGDDAFFQTNYVTCLVETTLQTDAPDATSAVKELAAFAVDRKRHTFKGTVQAHDADTSSTLVNETHRLVARGRRRCLPGPEARDAFERFLKDSIEVDRIVVVRLLDDQLGQDLPHTFDIFRKVMRQDNFSNRDLFSSKGQSPPPQSEAKTRAPERAPRRRPPEAVLPGGGPPLHWLLPPHPDSLRLMHLSPPGPPPLASWRSRDVVAGPPRLRGGGGGEEAADRTLTIKVIEDKDQNMGKLVGPDEYGHGARRRRKPFCDGAAAGVETRHGLQGSEAEAERDEEAPPRTLGPFKEKPNKPMQEEVDLEAAEEQETRALRNYRERRNRNRPMPRSLEAAGAEAAAYRERKNRHVKMGNGQGGETRVLHKYRERKVKPRAAEAEVEPPEAAAEPPESQHDETRDKNNQPKAAVDTPATADNASATAATVAEGSDAPGAAAAVAAAAPEAVNADAALTSGERRTLQDLSPFPLDPTPQPPRGQNLPIKVPPKDIAQWPSHHKRHVYRLSRAAPDDDINGSSAAEAATTTTTAAAATTTATTTTPAPTKPPRATADGGGRAQAGRRSNHRPPPQATPFYFPELLWPLPFSRRGLPPGAAIPPPLYGWGPQAEPWLYARPLEAEQQADTSDWEERGGGDAAEA